MVDITNTLLGRETIYHDKYDPSSLTAIPRAPMRQKIGIANRPNFDGLDILNAYDFTWLDQDLIPIFDMLTIYVPASSEFLIESKSLKLYLYSFANSSFNSRAEVVETIKNDLSKVANANVQVVADNVLDDFIELSSSPEGTNIDDLDIKVNSYKVDPAILKSSGKIVTQTLNTTLFKSNCPVTNKPDWATVIISYTGEQIDKSKLLQYLVSYREHSAFHENCIEKIFTDLMKYCHIDKLSVTGRFTRRGNIDINPIRTNFNIPVKNTRLFNQ